MLLWSSCLAGRAGQAAWLGVLAVAVLPVTLARAVGGLLAAVSGAAYAGVVAGVADGERRFEDLVGELTGVPGVSPPRGGGGFGRSALRWQGKIFAMFVRGRLVVRLPADRVDDLVTAGEGARFDANKGTPMREWLSLDPGSGLEWLPLAQEALDFARSR
jgi:hypothetical protein